KGGALLALLQSKPQVAEQNTHTPLDHVITEPEQPASPQRHSAQHPPHAPDQYPAPGFPVAPNASDPWTAGQYANFGPAPGIPHGEAPSTMRHHTNIPGLVHPQPLPRQVQRTSVLEYTTP